MKNSLTNKKLLTGYYAAFSVSAVAFFIMLALTDGKSFSDTLFRNSVGSDFFMDFFNSIRDASTKNIYKEGIIYPPLANMFFYFLSLMIDPELVFAPFSHRSLMQKDYVCLFIYFTFVILTMFMFARLIKSQLKESKLEKFSSGLPLMLIFSYPMIYCVQRGNIALLSLVFSMFFIFNRNSENKLIRELSYILLAIAAGIKIYPAAFGLLLLTDKKFKEAIRLIIYGVICLVLPFFFYDGFESIKDIFDNFSKFSEFSFERISPGFVSVDVLAMYASLIFKTDYSSVYNFMITFTYLAALSVFIFAPKDWQKVWAIAYMIMNYTSTARTYILVLAIIPFIMFIVSEKFRKSDTVYYICFLLLLIVIPPVYYLQLDSLINLFTGLIGVDITVFESSFRYLASPNQLLSAFVVTGMTLYMFADTVVGIAKSEIKIFKRKRKN